MYIPLFFRSLEAYMSKYLACLAAKKKANIVNKKTSTVAMHAKINGHLIVHVPSLYWPASSPHMSRITGASQLIGYTVTPNIIVLAKLNCHS